MAGRLDREALDLDAQQGGAIRYEVNVACRQGRKEHLHRVWFAVAAKENGGLPRWQCHLRTLAPNPPRND
jgi:hypothetical protein